MPPFLTSDVVEPVVQGSPHRMVPVIRVPPPPKPRTYTDEPLPLKPSDHAPRKATIKERIALPDKVAYTIDIGGFEVQDVGIDEILDYVSAFDLEQYEHRQFQEQAEIMRIVQLEREAEEYAEQERRKARAKSKGKVYVSQSESDPNEDDEVETGRHGRARPTYKHLFKVPEKAPHERQRKRRRKRNPDTGELMPLSDEEDAAFVAPPRSTVSSARPPAGPAVELPKRRRRKRDKTGKLVPLSPVEQPEKEKRPRRRRHPKTGVLMPLGWRYDPSADAHNNEKRRDGMPSVNRLSIGREHDTKRVKLTSEEPSSDEEARINRTPTKYGAKGKIAETVYLASSSSEEPKPSAKSQQTPGTSILNPTPQKETLRIRPSPSAGDSSSEPRITLASFLKSSKQNENADSSSDESSVAEKNINTPGKTSIMNPMAAQTEDEHDGSEDDDLDEGEGFVEAILGHELSDPSTHPGKKQVMLYKTKWEGWAEPTWEPADSFMDQSVLEEYRKREGLDHASKVQKTHSAPESKKSTAPAMKSKVPAPITIDESDEDGEEDYVVEDILAHHMSDPRTHPGKPPVMLYQVKWQGWQQRTWEPRSSFTDKSVVRRYEKRVGLNAEEDDEDDSDGDDITMKM